MTINLKTICVIFMNHLYSSTLMLACFISKAGCWQQLHIFSLSSQCCCHFFLSLSANACPPVRLWAEASDVFWANKVLTFSLLLRSQNPLSKMRKVDAVNQIRTDHNSIPGWNGKPTTETKWDSPGGSEQVSATSLCKWHPVQKGK